MWQMCDKYINQTVSLDLHKAQASTQFVKPCPVRGEADQMPLSKSLLCISAILTDKIYKIIWIM